MAVLRRQWGGGFGMTPWCDDLVCSWRRLLADRHSLPFPWTLSLHRRWCPSASHHPLTFLFLLALTFPLPSPFPSLGLSLCRPPCPSASPHSFPSLSLGRLCQRSPRTCPVSLLCVESTQRGGGGGGTGQMLPVLWFGWCIQTTEYSTPSLLRYISFLPTVRSLVPEELLVMGNAHQSVQRAAV